MVDREISKTIIRYAKQYPVITITGPRQSGKTTLTKMIFKEKEYVSLEDIETRHFAINDPKGFLSHYMGKNTGSTKGIIIDEIQHAPDLLSYIQVSVDKDRKAGRYILTGSQNLQLMKNISQSLAGRTAIATLLPFTLKEMSFLKGNRLVVDDILYSGFYPAIHNEGLNPTEALSFYVTTYLERDLRLLINIKDLNRFTTFLKLCAGRTGQVINLSSLSNETGITHNTAKSWLSILEASFIIKLVQPYYKNLNKRLIKSPKLFFLDPGLASFLIGIQNPEQIFTHPLRGNLFETFVYSEILKRRLNQGKTDNIYYYRDRKGNEIDFILDYGSSISNRQKNCIYHRVMQSAIFSCKENNCMEGRYGESNKRDCEVLGRENI